jgi:hypothetical protein
MEIRCRGADVGSDAGIATTDDTNLDVSLMPIPDVLTRF